MKLDEKRIKLSFNPSEPGVIPIKLPSVEEELKNKTVNISLILNKIFKINMFSIKKIKKFKKLSEISFV